MEGGRREREPGGGGRGGGKRAGGQVSCVSGKRVRLEAPQRTTGAAGKWRSRTRMRCVSPFPLYISALLPLPRWERIHLLLLN